MAAFWSGNLGESSSTLRSRYAAPASICRRTSISQVGEAVVRVGATVHRGPDRDRDVLEASSQMFVRLRVPLRHREATLTASAIREHELLSVTLDHGRVGPIGGRSGRMDVLADDDERAWRGHEGPPMGLNWQPRRTARRSRGSVSSSTCSIRAHQRVELDAPRRREEKRAGAPHRGVAESCDAILPDRGEEADLDRVRDVDVGREPAGKVERDRRSAERCRARAAGSPGRTRWRPWPGRGCWRRRARA